MERVNSISNSLTASKKDPIVRDSLAYFKVGELLGPKAQEISTRYRELL